MIANGNHGRRVIFSLGEAQVKFFGGISFCFSYYMRNKKNKMSFTFLPKISHFHVEVLCKNLIEC